MKNSTKFIISVLLLSIGCTDIEDFNSSSVIAKVDTNKIGSIVTKVRVSSEPTQYVKKFDKFELIYVSSGVLKGDVDFSACVKIPLGYVLIGGGISSRLGNTDNFSYITSSFPNEELTCWTGTSKRKHLPEPYYGGIWAVGLKIYGVSENELRSNIKIFKKSISEDKIIISTKSQVTNDYLLIGGGVSSNYSITASISDNDNGWYTETSNGNGKKILTSFAIGLTKTFANKYKIRLNYNHWDELKEHSYSGGTATFKISLDPGFSIVNCGGHEISKTSRSIVNLYPTLDNQGLMSTSAYGDTKNNGRSRICTIGISIQ